MITADFDLQYDAKSIELIEFTTKNIEYNEIENGRIIVVYSDETGNGTDNIAIKFKTKEGTEGKNAKIEIKDINTYSIKEQKQYTTNDFFKGSLTKEVKILKNDQGTQSNGVINNQGTENNGVSNNQSTQSNNVVNGNEKNNTKTQVESKNNINASIPKAGIDYWKIIKVAVIGIITLVLSIILAKNKKIKSMVPVLAVGIILAGIMVTEAASNIYVKEYEKIKGYEKIIVINPDIKNRNITRIEFEKLLKHLNINGVTDENNKTIEKEELIKTGAKVSTEGRKNI